MKNIIFYLLLAVICMACEKVVDIDVLKDSDKIVMTGYLNPDTVINVHLAKSTYILNTHGERSDITDAKVVVYEEGKLLGQMEHSGYGWYRLAGYRPVPRKSYRIEAEHSWLGKVVSQEKVLEPVSVTDITVDTIVNKYGEKELDISFYVEDNGAEENFYMPSGYIEIVNYYSFGEDEEVFINKQPLYFNTADPSFEEFCYNSCLHLVSDGYFNGKRYKLNVRSDIYFSSGSTEKEEINLYFGLHHVTKSYYLYQATLQKQNDSEGDPFAEPVQIYSNVEGGYGVIGGISTSYQVIKIK